MGHLQVVILTLVVAIQCAGLFYVSGVWVGERDLVTILVSTMSSRSPTQTPLTQNNPHIVQLLQESKLQPEEGPHAGPKHVVVSPMY